MDGVAKRLCALVLMGMLCSLTGCASVAPPVESASVLDCGLLWEAMDEAIARDGAGDGYGARVAGFDYLRVDRFLAGLAQGADSTRKQRVLIEKMRMFDLQRRYLELDFLSDEAWAGLHQLGYPLDSGFFKRQVATCSVELMQEGRRDSDYFDKVVHAIDTDLDYSTLFRTLGLYPLTQFIVRPLVSNYQEEHQVVVTGTTEPGQVVRPPTGQKLSARRLQLLLRNSRQKPFLDFQLKEHNLTALIHYYAPVFDLGGESFGRITPGVTPSSWQVDPADPVVYYFLSQAMVQGIPALQLNYVVWFGKRTEPAPWYTTGHLDGITMRVTLDWQGRPLVFDAIGNCGCFYFGLTNAALTEVAPEAPGFTPHFAGELPPLAPKEHWAVQIEAGSNNVSGVRPVSVGDGGQQYSLVPYENLEGYSPALPTKLFDENGFVDGTDRFERYFLFPMGIPGVGAMRQRGRHPITLVGRAYFDDPYLFTPVLTVKEPLPKLKKLVKKGKRRKSNLKTRVESGKAMGSTGRGRKERYFRSRGMEM